MNCLATVFRQARQPIVWVRQELAPDLSDAFLRARRENHRVTIAGTDGCELLPELERHASERVLVKKRYSFFGTDLDETLAVLRPVILVLAGINTHACVRTTAIDRRGGGRADGDVEGGLGPGSRPSTSRKLEDRGEARRGRAHAQLLGNPFGDENHPVELGQAIQQPELKEVLNGRCVGDNLRHSRGLAAARPSSDGR